MKARDWLNQWLPGRTVLAPASGRDDVEALLRRMRPVNTGHALVRVGGEGDGGYLVPDDMAGVEACFSPGVANTATFELEMARRGIPSFMADYSVEGPPEAHPMFRFERKFLGPREDERHVTLDGWVGRCAPGTGDLVLQMDIEGAEWEVLLATADATFGRFRMMVLELHDVQRAWERGGLSLMRAALGRLEGRFVVAHVHPNNRGGVVRRCGLNVPPLVEVTWLRRDRVRGGEGWGCVPHPLDRPNVPGRPDGPLPGCWREQEGPRGDDRWTAGGPGDGC